MSIKIYSLDSRIGFGKYQGATVEEVLAKDPDYLVFCIKNLDHFSVSSEVAAALPKDLLLSARPADKSRQYDFEAEEEEEDNDDHLWHEEPDYDMDTFNALTDGQFGDYDDFCGDIDDVRTWSGL